MTHPNLRPCQYNGALRVLTGKLSYPHTEVVRTSADSKAWPPSVVQRRCEEDYKLGVWEPTADGIVWTWENTYATTIHAINSAIIKLSKLTVAQTVYRGLTGAVLPKQFFERDAEGLTGGVEFGFSSTTSDRKVAEFYAKTKKQAEGEQMASTIIEARMGMIDRGAELSWLSQFSHEGEIAFPPLVCTTTEESARARVATLPVGSHVCARARPPGADGR